MLAEKGAFDLSDVATAVCEKLIFRHTHIFGKDKAETAAGALSVWEKNKMKEKHQETFAQSVNDVAKGFPAAMRAQKVGKRAAKAGLDFATVDDAIVRLREEIAEFITAYQDGDKDKAEKNWATYCFRR
jgi:tetrapyrrole methylase family protein/MazG family protein